MAAYVRALQAFLPGVNDALKQLATSNYTHVMNRSPDHPHVDGDNPDNTRYKWCLGCFDRTTEMLVWSRELPITSADARHVLDLKPSVSLEGGFFLTNVSASRLNEFLDDKISFEFEKFEYDIELTDIR